MSGFSGDEPIMVFDFYEKEIRGEHHCVASSSNLLVGMQDLR